MRYGLMNLSQLRQVEETLAGLRRNSKNKKIIETVLEPFFSTLEADAGKPRASSESHSSSCVDSQCVLAR